MSSHILADVERVCDTIGIIARGRLLVKASRDALLARYATPIFELEIEPGLEGPLNAWAAATRQKSWVQTLTLASLTVRVVVTDLDVAKHDLLASAVQAGLILTRFEMLKPSLEEVFLRLVDESGQSV
jgi:ABC-2 type transport system ATP-binding protein